MAYISNIVVIVKLFQFISINIIFDYMYQLKYC